VFVKLVVGATGAVTSGTGNGVASVTKETAAGQYTVLLSDSYNTFVGCQFTLVHTTDSDPTTVAVAARVKAEAVNASKNFVIQGYALDDGAAANFADGAILYMVVTLKNSSV
jgi:hypothetical protein